MRNLTVCRETMGEIRRLTAVLADARRLENNLGGEEAVRMTEAALRQARLQYVQALSRSIADMTGMHRGQRAVLWRYYVLGMSITQVSSAMNYSRRSVCRLKKDGISYLENREEARVE